MNSCVCYTKKYSVKMWNFYNSCGFWNFAKFFTIYVMMTNYNCLIYCKSLFSGKHDAVLKYIALQSKFSFYIANILYLYYTSWVTQLCLGFLLSAVSLPLPSIFLSISFFSLPLSFFILEIPSLDPSLASFRFI